MAEPRNPFRHHHGDDHDHDHDHGHGHGHDHGHDHGDAKQELDPAQQALSDALRVCFAVLKIVIVILLVLYCFSGMFTVPNNHAAVKLRWGKIVGEGKGAILQPGFNWAWPYPIEEAVIVNMTEQTVEMRKEFGSRTAGQATGKPGEEDGQEMLGNLNPELDGSLLTSDANIIHARISVNYQIIDPALYVTNVGEMQVANELVRRAIEQAVILSCSQQPADSLIKTGLSSPKATAAMAQKMLDEQGAGIQIVAERLSFKARMPGSVKEAFNAVTNAETERATVIEQAQQERNKVLAEVAGEASEALWRKVWEYQRDTLNAPREVVDAKDAEMDKIFRDLKVDDKPITGRVAEIINEAVNYRSAVVSDVRGEAANFDSLYNRYKDAPSLRRVIMEDFWQNARKQILSGDVQTFYLPPGQSYIDINVDPAITKAREQKRLKDEQEARDKKVQTVGNAGPPPPR